MITKLRQRIESEKGFTLIEMLIVIIILGILLAIAIPAYLKFRDRANNAASQADIRSAIPAVEAYDADNNGYASMTGVLLRSTYDTALKASPAFSVKSATATTYCLKSTVGNAVAYKNGPGNDIVVNPATAPC